MISPNEEKPNALILIGGRSSRMGEDKSDLIYHGKPQYQYLYEIASSITDQVFLSCNAEQAKLLKEYPLIVDKISFSGPMHAIKEAFEFMNCNWLIIPCDMPLINQEELNRLIQADSQNDVVCFKDENEIINPLLALYKKSCRDKLLTYKGDSPKEFLNDVATHSIPSHKLTNVNTIQERNEFLKSRVH